MSSPGNKLAILVGGGPAPGINGVIAAATIRAHLDGVDVVGILDGFEGLMGGAVDTLPLSIADVSRLHFSGGSVLRTSRANPTRHAEHLDTVVAALIDLGVDKLITVGGDDTAFSAMRVEERAAGRVRVAHVPKTIDNDLDLPHGIWTFGFQTARHHGVEIVRRLMVDGLTTSRWYFVVSMGRKAGHLALGIGKAAGATLTVIPEEFPGGPIPLRRLVDLLVGAVIKRESEGRRDGVAILAEGLVERIEPADLAALEGAERDEHGHVRLAEISFGDLIKREVRRELASLGIQRTIVSKDIGYELRCADPIPFDIEYTRDLGHCAAAHLLEGAGGAMVSIQEGRFVPMPFAAILDRSSGKMRVRMVDVSSESYRIARRYMLRLTREDFSDPHLPGRYAAACGLTEAEFRTRFAPIAESDVWTHPSRLAGGPGA